MARSASLHVRATEEEVPIVGTDFHGLGELREVRAVSLLPPRIDETAELLLAKVVLGQSEAVPVHLHLDHAEGVFVKSGAVTVQRGRGRAELRARGAAYFPAGVPHGIVGKHQGDSEVLVFYPRADLGKDVSSVIVQTDSDQSPWDNPNVVKGNDLLWRWAVAEEAEPWMPVEPTKGLDLRLRFLFDPTRGAGDLVIGTGMMEPNHHYTRHRHAPAEFYHVLGGSGVIHVDDESYEVAPGSTVYVPANAVHGADTHSSHLNDLWVYGLDGSGQDWVWEAQEDVFDTPSLDVVGNGLLP